MIKTLTTVALSLMASASIIGQTTEKVTLPFSFCNQTEWQAVETTIQLGAGQEEVTAYELQDFKSITSVQRSGKVYYVPSDLDDRTIMVMKNVNIRETHPYIIDNPTDKTFILHIEGKTTLSCLASVIHSQGPVQILGPETDDDEALADAHTLTLSPRGRGGRAAIEARGDVYLQDLMLTIEGGNAYGIRTIPIGKEPAVLTLNNVTGKISGKPSPTAGFAVVEGRNSDVAGVKVTNIEEEEDMP